MDGKELTSEQQQVLDELNKNWEDSCKRADQYAVSSFNNGYFTGYVVGGVGLFCISCIHSIFADWLESFELPALAAASFGLGFAILLGFGIGAISIKIRRHYVKKIPLFHRAYKMAEEICKQPQMNKPKEDK